jgi:hypothetical protein
MSAKVLHAVPRRAPLSRNILHKHRSALTQRWVRVKALCRILPAFSPRQGQSADDPIWGMGSRAALAIPTGDGRRRVMRDNRREVNRKQLLGPSKPSPGIHHGEIGPVHSLCHAPLVPLAPARVLNSLLPSPHSVEWCFTTKQQQCRRHV